ncbi:MAG TPA: leucyl/phenylalanyl-tRNA--protein transferase [Gammaproteobacteria bacterium]|nr:leucyl/phenylalanyl-tRNA--protein transferase [Gammaproteobacteria bacterium]
MSGIAWIDARAPACAFPDPSRALRHPNGLLAAGGDLGPERLIAAYKRGIFPWYSAGEPILWWSPDPRTVFLPGGVHVSRRLARRLRRGEFGVTLDRDFAAVVRGCAEPRRDHEGTWLTPEMQQAYCRLHALGVAHSVEVWAGDELAGGLYGVALGRVFFGESMFRRRSDASKVALAVLSRQLRLWNFLVFDCQVGSPHLYRMGAVDIPRQRFLELVQRGTLGDRPAPGPWRLDDQAGAS